MVQEILTSVEQTLGSIWWIIILFFLFFVARDRWLYRVQSKFINNIKWVLLEIKIPKEDVKSPQVMEQFFNSLRAMYSFGIRPEDKWLKGQGEEWISAEMVSSKDGIKFYIRVSKFFRNLVEASFFAHYPEAEIEEVEDYIKEMPEVLPDDTYDIWGSDYILSKPNIFPIKTYPNFFRDSVKEEEQTDPVATIAEVMSGLKSDERIWIQILIRPTGDDWKKEAVDVINNLTGRKKPAAKSGVLNSILDFIINFAKALTTPPVWSGAPEEKPSGPNKMLTPGEQDIAKGIEGKIAKVGYETLMRFIYIDSKNSFTKSNGVAVIGAISQFNTLNLNAFRPASTITQPPRFFFKKSTLLLKKKSLYKMYRERAFYRNQFFPVEGVQVTPPILNVEELATIFHPPMPSVVAAGLRRVESKKAGPPTGLPTK
jgi:hypothetical protein